MSDIIDKFYNAYNGSSVDIARLIKDEKIELDENANLDNSIVGQIERLPDDSFKISVNQNDSDEWKRFTMAHELGHFVFHKHLINGGIDDNRAYFSTDNGNYNNPNIKAIHEFQANVFACSVLIPKDKIHNYIVKFLSPDNEEMETPEQHFQVPLGVIKWWLDLDDDQTD